MNKKVSALYYYVVLLAACLTAAVILTSCNSCSTFLGKTESFTFVQISDTQLGFSDYQQDIDSFRQAVIQINDLDPSFVVICGDLVNNASDKSFSDFKDIKNSLKMPCYCVPGNHDIGNKPTQESLRRYRKIIGEDYFVVEHIGTTFIFVNTQLWKEVVEGVCKKADEAEEYMNLPFDKRMELLSLYDQNNVIAILHGHTHTLSLNNYNDIQMVGAETTSKNFDKRPLGFRLWYVEDKLPPKHEFVPLGKPNP